MTIEQDDELRRRVKDLHATIEAHHLRVGRNGVSWMALIPSFERVIVMAGPDLDDLKMLVQQAISADVWDDVEYVRLETKQ